jgi:hypothetical protein
MIIPFATILSAQCQGSVCVYGNGVFRIDAFDSNGDTISSKSSNYFSIDKTAIVSPEQKTEGSAFGGMIGASLGVSAIIGDMILALMFSSIMAIVVAYYTKEPIITILVFLTGLTICAIAGYLPVWIIAIEVIFAGFLITNFLSGIFTGES